MNELNFSIKLIPKALPGGPIADLGCGNGLNSRLLAKHTNRNLICVDNRQGAIEATREKMRGFKSTFLLNDVCRLGIKDNSCALVYASRIFSHIKDKKIFFKEAMRIVKNNGYLIIVDDEKCLNFFKKSKLKFSHLESAGKMVAITLKKGF
ncbi:hypothetical protein CL645_00465 [bacterium]|nr:hypothetical protein [bacterium]|tara:strand:+ start:324 stop:776 length:453 start_codon:yes stop_codon:yes gene_type:complete